MSETCEDRNYECCNAFPCPAFPSIAEYEDWYDDHVAYWEKHCDEDPTAGFWISQERDNSWH